MMGSKQKEYAKKAVGVSRDRVADLEGKVPGPLFHVTTTALFFCELATRMPGAVHEVADGIFYFAQMPDTDDAEDETISWKMVPVLWDSVFDQREAAKYLNTTRQTIARWGDKGLEGIRIGKHKLYFKSELDRFKDLIEHQCQHYSGTVDLEALREWLMSDLPDKGARDVVQR